MSRIIVVGLLAALSCAVTGCPQKKTGPEKTTAAPPKKHTKLTVGKAYWFHSKERPEWIPDKGIPKDKDGHLLLHIEEWNEGPGIKQYKAFYDGVDRGFTLKAEGQPDVAAAAERGYWKTEFYVRIPAKGLASMKTGVAYTLHPKNGKPEYQWQVKEGVTITKP